MHLKYLMTSCGMAGHLLVNLVWGSGQYCPLSSRWHALTRTIKPLYSGISYIGASFIMTVIEVRGNTVLIDNLMLGGSSISLLFFQDFMNTQIKVVDRQFPTGWIAYRIIPFVLHNTELQYTYSTIFRIVLCGSEALSLVLKGEYDEYVQDKINLSMINESRRRNFWETS